MPHAHFAWEMEKCGFLDTPVLQSLLKSHISMDFSGLAGDPLLQQSSYQPCRTTVCIGAQNDPCLNSIFTSTKV